MRKYLLISLFSTIVTFFVSFYLFNPVAFNRFLNSINPFKADNPDFIFSDRNQTLISNYLFDYDPENQSALLRFFNSDFRSGSFTQNFTLPSTEQFDRKADYLQTLLKDTTEKSADQLVFRVPNNWSVESKNSGSTEITTSNQNTVKITYTDLSNIDPKTFNYEANNVTKDTLSELLYADVGYSYPSLVNKDSSMVLINVMQKNGVDKVKLWFKEYPNGQSNISTVKYSPVNTVIYLDGKDLYILNASISESTSESAVYEDLSNLDNLIESLKK